MSDELNPEDDVTTNEPTSDATAVDAPVDDSQPTVDGATTDSTSGTDATVDAQASDDADAWRKPYEELGFQNLQSPEEAHQRLVESYRLERERAAEAKRQADFHQAIVTQLSRNNPAGTPDQPTTAPTQAAAPKGLFGQFKEQWTELDREQLAEYVTRDEDGNPTWAPNTPAELRAKAEAFRMTQKKWLDVVQDPRQLSQAIETHVEELISARLNDVLTQRESMTAEQRAEQEFFAQNDWLFQKDPVSGQVSDQPSAEGVLFGKYLQHAQQIGINRVADMLDYAMAKYQGTKAVVTPPVAQRQQAADTAAAQRQKMLGRTNPSPAKPTSAAGINDGAHSDEAGSSRFSFGEAVARSLREVGAA